VRDEFARNRDRVVKESGRSLSGNIKRAKLAVWTYGKARQRRSAARVLEDIERRLSSSIDVTAESMKRIEQLFAKSSLFGNDEAAKQLLIYARHLNDPATGLMFHAYDESGAQSWADPVTHHSPIFWCRAIGWFGVKASGR